MQETVKDMVDRVRPGSQVGIGASAYLTSVLATMVRGGAGIMVVPLGARPDEVITLYETEDCPLSRKVREAMTMLDLDVLVKPCPKGARRHRREVQNLTGRQEFPVMFDPNEGRILTQSDDIIDYLFATYGREGVPWQLARGGANDRSSRWASRLRGPAAAEGVSAMMPHGPLELWGYEGSPSCRLVRERLSAHAIPYLLHNVALNSPKRRLMARRAGLPERLPFLFDSNTWVELSEVGAMLEYIDRRYGQAIAREAS